MASEASGTTGLGARYATALYDLADEQKHLDEVAADLRTLRALIDESADLRRLIRSPVVSRAGQGKAIAALAERATMLLEGFIPLLRRHGFDGTGRVLDAGGKPDLIVCSSDFSATQYALLSALAVLPRNVTGAIAGAIVPMIGWAHFFVVTCLSAVPGLILLVILRRPLNELGAREAV